MFEQRLNLSVSLPLSLSSSFLLPVSLLRLSLSLFLPISLSRFVSLPFSHPSSLLSILPLFLSLLPVRSHPFLSLPSSLQHTLPSRSPYFVSLSLLSPLPPSSLLSYSPPPPLSCLPIFIAPSSPPSLSLVEYYYSIFLCPYTKAH